MSGAAVPPRAAGPGSGDSGPEVALGPAQPRPFGDGWWPCGAEPPPPSGRALTSVSCRAAEPLAVMSVDMGSESMKIAIVKPGVPMEIVLNK